MKQKCLLFILLSVLFMLSLSCTTGPEEEEAASRVMFFSSSWGEDSIRITDDIMSLDNGATATPRIISGDSTTINGPSIDSLAVDKSRSILYLANTDDGNILVYENLTTAIGDITPERTITVSGISVSEGIDIDSGSSDRLYVGTGSQLLILDNASTLNGTVDADAVIDYNVMSIFLDYKNDRLYAGANYDTTNSIYVFDNASSLTTGATPDRTITITDSDPTKEFNPTGVLVDADNDRLYTCDNSAPNDHYLLIFDNACTLNGSYDELTDSVARGGTQTISLMVDRLDNLYAWPDSPNHVKIYYNASTLKGDITGPDKTIYNVVDSGYGMDYLPY
ncbi:MAG: hypothetical protein JXQ30_12680 [Spirochaetes bacterium]|nr:hypothetical protein [Spirochaetota bacterium]